MQVARQKKVTKIESPYIQQQDDRQQLKRKKRVGLMRRLTVFGVFVVTVTFFMVTTMIAQSAKIEQKQIEQEKLEEKLATLEEKHIHLEEEIVKLNDDEYIAKVARRDYFLSDKGEIIFKLPEESSSY